MARTKTTRKADLIISADWHVREDDPVCRTDNIMEAQAKKYQFIRELQLKEACPIVVAGDIFHHWKPSPFLISWAMTNLPHIHAIPGQHDLPNHNMELFGKCGLNVLELHGKVSLVPSEGARVIRDSTCVLEGFPWGTPPAKAKKPPKGWNAGSLRRVAVAHMMTWAGKKPWEKCEADGAKRVLRKFKGFDLVITGDNHQSFVVEKNGQLLVNPGSIIRSAADQIDFRPRVFLWYAEENTVEPVYLPISKKAVSREHLKKTQERDERMESFVRRLTDDFEAGFSFERNLETFFKKNGTRKTVRKLLNEIIGEES